MLHLVLYVRFPLCQRQTDRQTEAETVSETKAVAGHLPTSPRPVCKGEGPGDVYTKDKDPPLSSCGTWEWCLPRAREQGKGVL